MLDYYLTVRLFHHIVLRTDVTQYLMYGRDETAYGIRHTVLYVQCHAECAVPYRVGPMYSYVLYLISKLVCEVHRTRCVTMSYQDSCID